MLKVKSERCKVQVLASHFTLLHFTHEFFTFHFSLFTIILVYAYKNQ